MFGNEDILPMNINELNFEQAMSELESLVRRLEEGRLPLEEAITSYEKGMQLKAVCEKKLSEAKLRVDKIVQGSQGSPELQPFDNAA
jgi:exodeoxyribonuclease VII small subunit